ncbi:MAG: hypothetical protein ACREN2_06140 [Candidatus Dormibacteria bacterium]
MDDVTAQPDRLDTDPELALAIADLAKAADERRTAHDLLEQVTSAVAASIAEQLQPGDCAEVPTQFKDAEALYAVNTVFDGRGQLRKVLVRGGPRWMVDDDLDEPYHVIEHLEEGGDERQLTSPDHALGVYFRTAQWPIVLEDFAREAKSLAAAFAQEVRDEAEGYRAAAAGHPLKTVFTSAELDELRAKKESA